MSGQKNILITSGIVLSIGLIVAILSVAITSQYYSRQGFNQLNAICEEILEQEPEAQKIIPAALKEYTNGNIGTVAENDILSTLGYSASDFTDSASAMNILFVIISFLTGVFLFGITFLYRNKVETKRIQALANYLEQVNTGKAVILGTAGEDEFSKLEDEIYKTVTSLYQTKDTAIETKNGFADNLANIAHQLKTPITAISLATQMMRENNDRSHLAQIEKQLVRLTHLEESLLVLSRLDAGTLVLQRQETDVFTILMLAADNLQELFDQSKTALDIAELGEMAVFVDLEWTMEAIMNLMKNCMEHNRGGWVHCTYAQNPLYTEILIWDEGEGFAKEDIPYLFERFYRGQNASEGGIGIGLALSKEIVERQNGTIRAKNISDTGACFEIRFYSH